MYSERLVTDYSNQGFGVWYIRAFPVLIIGTRDRRRRFWAPSLVQYPEGLDWL